MIFKQMKLFVCFVLLITVLACNVSNKSDQLNSISTDVEKNDWTFDSLSLRKRMKIDSLSTDSGMLIYLYINYPSSVPNGVDLSKIQEAFVRSFLDTDTSKVSLEQALEKQWQLYEKEAIGLGNKWREYYEADDFDSEGFPMFEDYYRIITTDTVQIIDDFMSIASTYYAYLGGAHGGRYSHLYNIDIIGGKRIDEKELFKIGYENELAKIIQTAIEKRNSSGNIDDYIDLLVDDPRDVKPNNNFYFSAEGIYYVYNEYEITPYSQGMVKLLLSYTEILPLVKDEYVLKINRIINKNKS